MAEYSYVAKISKDNVTKDIRDLGAERTTNRVTSFQTTPDDTHYASEKLVKDSLDGKVDKIAGKGLSKNDFTDALKTKLDGIQTGANASDVAYDSTNGKLKKTVNGTTSDVVTVDAEPTENSKNPVQSGGVHGALGEVNDDVEALQTSVQNLESTANQFIENGAIVDKVPYNFRKTGGNENVGTALVEKIVGGTIAWNQLVTNGDFRSTNEWAVRGSSLSVTDNIATVTFTSAPTSYYSNRLFYRFNTELPNTHKFFVTMTVKQSRSSQMSIYINNATNLNSKKTVSDAWTNMSCISAPNSNAITNEVDVALGDDYNVHDAGDTFSVKCCMVIDLTQMFGIPVADYIYTLEQTTAGAGVSLLKSLFPNSYYAYNAGELMSVQTAEKNTVGFNQWDEEWEIGEYNSSTGAKANASNRIRSKNFIPCLPSTAYYDTAGVWKYFYDKNKVFIPNNNQNANSFTTPSNAYYITWNSSTSYGTTYKNDICINLSDPAKNGTYEPYQKRTYPLDSSLTLRGATKLDANNQIYYDGDTYEADGKVTRRYGVVDLGTLTWSLSGSGDTAFFYTTQNIGIKPLTYNVVCTKYVLSSVTSSNTTDKAISITTDPYIRIRDTTYSDASSFKSAISGVYIVFELATPTTETASPYTNPQTVDPSGTEEFVDAGVEAETRDVSVPVGHESQYMIDIAGKLNNLPWDLSMIAPIENGTTASQAYAQGKYFLRNNQFCKAKTSIASGATFTLGTNYEVTTVAAELFAALS